jgi:hypothetical protein
MIYYQNGMQNNEKDVQKGVDLLSKLTKQEVGIIHNDTNGMLADTAEYLEQNLTIKDILNAKKYEEIANNGQQNLLVSFSAGNEDLAKAMQVLKLEKRNLNNKIDLISIASPVKITKLEKYAQNVGLNVIGQYNDWKDPVVNAKTWVAGALGLTVGGAILGGVVGGSAGAKLGLDLTAKTGLEVIFNMGLKGTIIMAGGAAGGAAGFGGSKYSLQKHHSLANYICKNIQNVQGEIVKWSKSN